MIPVSIKVRGKNIFIIRWDDNSETQIKIANLRRNCPCAICASERNEKSSSYIPIYSNDQMTIKNISTIGGYAIAIEWKDNHNTGIYDFSLLKKISNS